MAGLPSAVVGHGLLVISTSYHSSGYFRVPEMTDEFTEIGQNTDEEDKYIKMKDFYKQGKKDCKDLYLAGAGVTAHEMAQEYTHHEEYIQQYLAGWNYMLHLIDIGEE